MGTINNLNGKTTSRDDTKTHKALDPIFQYIFHIFVLPIVDGLVPMTVLGNHENQVLVLSADVLKIKSVIDR